MSPLTEPTKLTLRKTWQPMDPDAAAYITAVETADGQALEEKVKIAIDNFVLGCKADGIWSAIKASCILAGARTLNGALVPLAGSAPINFNFVSGDYNRKTGLVGNGSTKYLDSSRKANADPNNNTHLSCFLSTQAPGSLAGYLGTATPSPGKQIGSNASAYESYVNGSFVKVSLLPFGFTGSSLKNGVQTARVKNALYTAQSAPNITSTGSIFVFAKEQNGYAISFLSSRLAFYSIGEALDLALLDARVTDLINAFGAAIP